jgi:hypothetical protein
MARKKGLLVSAQNSVSSLSLTFSKYFANIDIGVTFADILWYYTHKIRIHAELIVIYLIGVSLFYAILLLLVVE